uniref:Homeobox-leucine zipper protein n=1 Tax=Kalanchoe fedtschenkoi TaxID=63787 RepID=A0A7N0RBJ6_KALFE
MNLEVGGSKQEGRSGKNGKRRRFSDEQIKSLEIMFGSESKPEPRTKQQLASDLGLHPRQVAIWFQNRRARLKSKQIEREYNILKASFDTLASKYECLKKENQALAAQVQKLRDQLGKDEGSTAGSALPSKQSWRDEEPETDGYLHESKGKPTYILESYDYETDNKTLVDTSIANPDWLKDEDDIQNLAEPVGSSLTSSENSWDSSCFLDQTGSSSLLWEFWS